MAKVIHLRNIRRALQVEPPKSGAIEAATKYAIGGRVSNFRTYKSFNFIDLVDGSTNRPLQVLVKRDILRKPQLGSYLVCHGELTASPGTKQAVEFKVDQLNYVGECDPSEYPLADANKSDTIPDGWFRQNLHLRPRAEHFASLLRVRSELEMGLHLIFKQMDFFKVHTPILTANDSEASSDLFMVRRSKCLDGKQRRRQHLEQQPDGQQMGSVSQSDANEDDDDDEAGNESESHSDDELQVKATQAERRPGSGTGMESARRLQEHYFRGKDVFMITSAQLHLECLAASLSRVYCLAPAFRAESSLSQRHLCEFTMLEAEESNVTSIEPLMDRCESIVKFCSQYLGEVSEFNEDFANLVRRNSNETIYTKLTDSKYIRMSYDEAVDILKRLASEPGGRGSGRGRRAADGAAGAPISCHYGCDINRKHERALLEHCNNVPIFLTHYPKGLKPFYMKSCDDSPDKVHNFDLIAPFGGEICGGSLREDNLDVLRKALSTTAGATASGDAGRSSRFDWYLELREFGSFPHGGFGFGLERLIQSMLGIKNIKDTIAFPRWPGNCSM
jgi:asparaginyl-tRNA synthetase